MPNDTAITWNNVNLSSIVFCGIHLKFISPEVLKNLLCKAAFTRDATGSATAARQSRNKNRNIGTQQERSHGDTLHAADAQLLRARAAI